MYSHPVTYSDSVPTGTMCFMVRDGAEDEFSIGVCSVCRLRSVFTQY